MDLGIIITAIAGAVTSFASAWVSWFFTRKKYNTEVDNNLIHNMKESLDFYKSLSDDNKSRLDYMIERNERYEEEMKDLQKQVNTIITYVCVNLTCQLRQKNLDIFKDYGTKVI